MATPPGPGGTPLGLRSEPRASASGFSPAPDLAAGAPALSGGAVVSLLGRGPASVLRTGTSIRSTNIVGSSPFGVLPAGTTVLGISALITGGGFSAGCIGAVGIAGPVPARNSIIKRVGLEGCGTPTSTGTRR